MKRTSAWNKLSNKSKGKLNKFIFDLAMDGLHNQAFIDQFDSEMDSCLENIPEEEKENFLKLALKARNIGIYVGEVENEFTKNMDWAATALEKLKK